MPNDRVNKRRILQYSEYISNGLSNIYGPMIRAPVRATELAFFLYGMESKRGGEIRPGWDVPKWNRDYKEGPRTRILWNQLELNDHVDLLYRVRETTAHIKPR